MGIFSKKKETPTSAVAADKEGKKRLKGNTGAAFRILKRPLLTEKALIGQEQSVYTFRVDQKATKAEIKRAVEQVYGTKVALVRTARMSGKLRRLGRSRGRTSDWKKATVSLMPGEKKIELYAN